MRRTAAITASVLLGVTLLAGCGDEQPAPDTAASTPASSDPPSGAPSTGSGDTSDGTVITVTVDGDAVTPNGERVEVGVDEPIQLAVTADAPGEIHVHSSPEQEYEYAAGSTTIDLTPIERPGIVDVESHTLDKTIVQLQVQ